MPIREPLRVGMFCPYSLSIPGGVQMQVMGLAQALRQTGIEVRVLGPCDGPPPATFVTPLGNSLPTAANGSIAPLAPDPAASLRTVRALVDEQFDVIHVHEPFAPGPTMTAVIVQSAPIVGTFHAAGHSSSYDVFGPLIRKWSQNLAYRAVVSVDAQRLIERVAPGEYDVLYNGVDLPVYRNGVAHPTEGPTIFFCGRHEERKGLDVLLRAMSLLGSDVRLWVGSSGPDSDRLRAEYAQDSRIEFLGRLTDTDKQARLRGADVFCAPSLHGESFGVVLVEAMAAGTAVVASSLDGYRNVATDDVDALLVQAGDVGALAAALGQVLGQPALRARLVDAGHNRADAFSMERLAEHYAVVYRRLVAAADRDQSSAQRGRGTLVRRRLARMMGR